MSTSSTSRSVPLPRWVFSPLGALRIALALPTMLVLSLATVASKSLPGRIRGLKPPMWLIMISARWFNWLFNIRVDCAERNALKRHEGFILGNHSSYLDVFVLSSVVPSRYLAAQEYKNFPILGWAAQAANTIWVDRKNTRSRAQALIGLGKVDRTPPFGLFPEGMIGPLGELQPFYHGVYKVCVDNAVPYAQCAIIYEDVPIMGWGDEGVASAIWRLACTPGPNRAELRLLEVRTPEPGENPRQLAVAAHRAVAAVLGYASKM